MSVTIDQKRCIHCKRCYDRCPEESFAVDENGAVYVKYPEECWLCGACEMDCPVKAIQVNYEINAQSIFVSL